MNKAREKSSASSERIPHEDSSSSLANYEQRLTFGLYEKSASNINTSSTKSLKTNASKLLLTIVYYVMMACFGLTVGSIGPSLPYLSYLTQTPIARTGYLFTSRGLGALIGHLIAAKLFHTLYKKRNSPKSANNYLLVAVLIKSGIVTTIPHLNSWSFALVLYFISGVMGGLINMGCNLLLTWMWDSVKDAKPIVLSMNAFTALGCFVGPLLITTSGPPFNKAYNTMALLLLGSALLMALVQYVIHTSRFNHMTESVSDYREMFMSFRSADSYLPLQDLQTASPFTDDGREEGEATPIPSASIEDEQEKNLVQNDLRETQLANEPTTPSPATPMENEPQHLKVNKEEWVRPSHKLLLSTVLGLCLFGAAALECSFGGLITTYLRAKTITNNYERIALMNALFWLSLAITRFVTSLLIKWVKPGLLLTLSIVGIFTSIAFFLVGPQAASTGWGGCILMGMSVASLYPAILSFAQAYLAYSSFTGGMNLTTLLLASSAEIIVPIYITHSFLNMGVDAMLWVLLGVAMISFSAYIIMYFLSYNSRETREASLTEENELLLDIKS